MKRIAAFFICICFVLGFTACDTQEITQSVDEIYTPKFMDIEQGKVSLQSYDYITMGWSLRARGSYFFAVHGNKVLRYNSLENKVDRIVDMGEYYKNGLSFLTSFSSDGRYMINYSSDPHYGKNSYNYFLVDFENETSEFLCENLNDSNIKKIINQKIPGQIKPEMRDDGLGFDIAEPEPIDIGKELEEKITPGHYATLDPTAKTICAIMPVRKELEWQLGYYKFAVIDVESGDIAQEYILGDKVD